MRSLHVLDHSIPLQSGYTFRTLSLLTEQRARGWETFQLTTPRHTEPYRPVETVDGWTFHRTPPPGGPSVPVLRERAEMAATEKRLDEIIPEIKPDLLHAHSPVLDGLAARIVARRRKLPLVYEIRAFWEDAAVGNGTGQEGSRRYRLIRALETWLVRRTDAVAVICEGLRSDLVARGIDPAKVFVSPNGVDMTLFGDPPPPDAQLARDLGLEGETIGFIGSFYDYEGLDDLIAAMPALVAARSRLKLLLVGGGPMEAALRAQAAASPVASAIRFVGRVPHDAVERYYGVVDVLVYPRKRMRLTDLVTPLKPLEAMAQRRLVAASDVGGHRELIRDGDTGTLFPADDPQALAGRVAALFADRGDWEAMRSRARSFVERERNWSSNVSRYAPVYHALVKGFATDAPWTPQSLPDA